MYRSVKSSWVQFRSVHQAKYHKKEREVDLLPKDVQFLLGRSSVERFMCGTLQTRFGGQVGRDTPDKTGPGGPITMCSTY